MRIVVCNNFFLSSCRTSIGHRASVCDSFARLLSKTLRRRLGLTAPWLLPATRPRQCAPRRAVRRRTWRR